jgi:hypothetical protein
MKTLTNDSNRAVRVRLVAPLIILILLLVVAAGMTYWTIIQVAVSPIFRGGTTMAGNVLTHNLSEPLNGAKSATVDIDAGDGNLTIDQLASGEPVLASGTLQYLEKQGLPSRSLNISNGQADLTLRGEEGAQPWFRFPWSACNGATEWQIHLNPNVQFAISAHSDGGNVKLDFTGMHITRIAADTGGGNMDVVLPDNAADLDVAAKTGAGNVTVDIGNGITGSSIVNAGSGAGNVAVHLPSGVAARIHASSGLGKVIVDPQFAKIDINTFQSADYDHAAIKIEITANSGAGNVSISTK